MENEKLITLEEAIKHCEEQAEKHCGDGCGMEHKQLSEWLQELQQYRSIWKDKTELPKENVPIIVCCIGDILVMQGVFKIINKGYESETYKIGDYGWDIVKKWEYMEELFPYRNHEIPIYFENELVEGDKHHNRELESYKAWEESLLYADRIRGCF